MKNREKTFRTIRLIGLICLIGLIIFVGLDLAKTASAEEPVLPTVDQTQVMALTITPSIFEGVVPQGKTVSQTFQLKNSSGVPLPIKCYIRNFAASDEEGGVAIPEEADGNRYLPQNWIQIVSPDFILQPQTSHEITINFNPPIDLPPGGYYGILFAEPLLPESFLDSSSIQIGGRLGSLLFLVSPGDISEKGKIASVNFPHYIFGSKAPGLKIRFENQGNVHLRPEGKITLTNRLTKKAQTLEVQEFTVLPGRIRQQIVSTNKLKWPGAYQAKVQLYYGRDKITLDKTLTFYYLPVVPIAVIIVVLGFIVVLVLGKTRKRIIKAIRVVVQGEK